MSKKIICKDCKKVLTGHDFVITGKGLEGYFCSMECLEDYLNFHMGIGVHDADYYLNK
ncbi:hypothetical protein [Lactobacillus rizhaonensis]|uniref:hypothetical protein n=1 Tax=Lactobacillus rizhaonensis TaxID=3082863 RepID=UPI0030C742F4